MSDQSPLKVEAIPPDAIIKIEIGGGFYGRLHQLLYGLSIQVNPEEYQKLLTKIKEDKSQEEPLAYHIETVLHLISEIETQAKAQGQTKMIEVPKEQDQN